MKLIKEIESRRDSKGRLMKWAEFLCEIPNCNKIVERRLDNGLKAKSCGCDKIKHGESHTRLYDVWSDMKKRCLNPKNQAYKDYGGRGIKVCNEWLEFIPFRDWSLANGYKEDLQINRILNDGNYEPSNCDFLTPKENSRHRRNQKIKSMEMANEIRTLHKTGNYTQRELAIKYNVRQPTISLIILNKLWG